jgi:DNA-binding NtrC family response regulator
VFRDGDTIEVSALPAALRGQACAWSRQPASRTDTPIEPMTEARTRMNIAFERAYLCQLLTLTSGSISGAARLSGVDRTSLKRLLKRHEIAAQTYRAI